MGNNWTKEQLDAITERDCNLLVAAAAGAGKTAVLVERIIRKITDTENPVDIDKLLVVTFTNAAATEMRERIGNALAEALDRAPSSANLQKQMALLDRASIMTLHSFCLEVVRSHFHALDLDPLFRIADETEAALMRLDALDQLFEEKYENEDKDSLFFKLVESYGGGRDDNSLRDIVMTLHRFIGSHPWPGQWLADQAEAYNTGASACLSSTPWARVLLNGAAAELQGLKALLDRAAAQASQAEGLEPYCGVLEADMEMLDGLLSLCIEALESKKTSSPEVLKSHNASSPAAVKSYNTSSPAVIDDNNTSSPAAIKSYNTSSPAAIKSYNTSSPAAVKSYNTSSPAVIDDNNTSSLAAVESSNKSSPAAIESYNSENADADNVWDKLHAAFAAFEPARLPRCGKNADKAVQEEVKEARNTMKERIKKLYASGFDASSAEIREDLSRLYPQLKYLSEMVLEYDAIYRQKKKDKGLLDFNDLEHYCLQVLLEDGAPSAAAKELRARYDEILIDEYQDSNLIQELIISVISGNDDSKYNIFMVGDVKQSIYRFRQARPELFLSKYMTYHREKGFENRVIQLYRNFRSRHEVIDLVNFIFRQIMSEEVGELDYTENEYLNPGAEFAVPENKCITGGLVELHIIDLSSSKTEIIPGGPDESDIGGNDDSDSVLPADGTGHTSGFKLAQVTDGDGYAAKTKNAYATGSNEYTSGTKRTQTGSSDEGIAGMQKDSGRASDEIEDEDGSEEEESLDKIQYEARIVGNRIRALVTHEPDGFNIYDKKLGGYRPVEYKDIVILMRATKNWGDVFTEELAMMGIPAYADTGLGYFRTVEVETMLSLLQIIDNPLQDIPMLAVLRSPVGGFSTDDLADIRLADRSVSIYEAMLKLAGPTAGSSGEASFAEDTGLADDIISVPFTGSMDEVISERTTGPSGKTVREAAIESSGKIESETTAESSGKTVSEATIESSGKTVSETTAEPSDEAISESTTGTSNDIDNTTDNMSMPDSAVVHKTRKFLADLERWRDASQHMPTDELVWQLLLETGYYSYAGALPGGVERQANLRMLFERARQFEETSYRGLFNFINFINKLRSGGGDMGSAKVLGENDNVVRIMSIHKSKGLEFPVVIVAGCGKRFNLQDLNPSILLHQDLGFGPDLVDLDKRTIMPSLPKYAIRQKLRLETLSEEMRILYVAFTRAREKLIITGSVRDHEKACASWCQKAANGREKLSPYDMMQASSYMDWIGPAAARLKSAGIIRQAAAIGPYIDLIDDDGTLLEVKLWGTGASKLDADLPGAEETIRDWLSEEQENETAVLEAEPVIKALEWTYPYQALSTVPAKISVTELKRRSIQEEAQDSAEPFIRPMLERPLFMEPDKELSAAHKGTVMHFVMQHLDLDRLYYAYLSGTDQAPSTISSVIGTDQAPSTISSVIGTDQAPSTVSSVISTDQAASTVSSVTGTDQAALTISSAIGTDPAAPNASSSIGTDPTKPTSSSGPINTASPAESFLGEIRRQLSEMQVKELLTEAEVESVRPEAIAAFFGSSVGRRMLELNKSVHRETAFTIEIKCSEVSKELSDNAVCDEMMLLQGVIDCWFEAGGGLVLLDFKTDYVPAGRSDIIRDRYKVQIEYYTKALEKMTGKKVAERYLYLFFTGELIAVN